MPFAFSSYIIRLFALCAFMQVQPHCYSQTFAVFDDTLKELFCTQEGVIHSIYFRTVEAHEPLEIVVAHGWNLPSVTILQDLGDAGYQHTVTFSFSAIGYSQKWPSMSIGDLEGDGDEDIVVYWNRWNSFIPEQLFKIEDQGGTLVPTTLGGVLPPGYPSYQLSAGQSLFDVNGDGRQDILFGGSIIDMAFPGSNSTDVSYALIQNSQGQFLPGLAELPLGIYGLHHDLDGDGLEDVFGYASNGAVYFHNEGLGHFIALDTLENIDPPWPQGWVDLNGDGTEDIIQSRPSLEGHLTIDGYLIENGAVTDSITVFEHNSLGLYNSQYATFKDYDGDGMVDVLYTEELEWSDEYVFGLIRGDGTWPMSGPLEPIIQCEPFIYMPSDIDSDGDIDLVFYDFHCVYWLENFTAYVADPEVSQPFSFLVFPLPASDLLTIRTVAAPSGTRLVLFDELGRLLVDQPLDLPESSLDISAFSSGAYQLNLLDGSGRSIGRKAISFIRQ